MAYFLSFASVKLLIIWVQSPETLTFTDIQNGHKTFPVQTIVTIKKINNRRLNRYRNNIKAMASVYVVGDIMAASFQDDSGYTPPVSACVWCCCGFNQHLALQFRHTTMAIYKPVYCRNDNQWWQVLIRQDVMHFSTVCYKLNGLSSTDVQSCWTAGLFQIITLLCKDNWL